MSRQPEVLWAQRSDKVYLTISLPDAKDVSVKTEPEDVFSFSATGPHGEAFTFSLQLYGSIVPELTRSFLMTMIIGKKKVRMMGFSIRNTFATSESVTGCS